MLANAPLRKQTVVESSRSSADFHGNHPSTLLSLMCLYVVVIVVRSIAAARNSPFLACKPRSWKSQKTPLCIYPRNLVLGIALCSGRVSSHLDSTLDRVAIVRQLHTWREARRQAPVCEGSNAPIIPVLLLAVVGGDGCAGRRRLGARACSER